MSILLLSLPNDITFLYSEGGVWYVGGGDVGVSMGVSLKHLMRSTS